MDRRRRWLVDFNAGRTQLFRLTGQITLVQLIGKWMCLFLRKNDLSRCRGCLSLLNWIVALALYLLLKLPPLFVLWSFFLLRLLCKSNAWACMEYCCYCLEMLDKLQKRICGTVGSSPAASLEPLAHHGNVASLTLFYMYYFGRCSFELT